VKVVKAFVSRRAKTMRQGLKFCVPMNESVLCGMGFSKGFDDDLQFKLSGG
jgi:hypothetical protein